MAIPDGYHFTLNINGTVYPFVFPDILQYVVTDLSAFTQRTSSGQLTLSNLTHQGAFQQLSAHGGYGQFNMTEENRFQKSDTVDTRHPGYVALWAQLNAIQLDPNTGGGAYSSTVSATDGDDMYVAMGASAAAPKVWHFGGTSATDVTGSGLPGSGVVNAMLYNGTSIFLAFNNDSIYVATANGSSALSWSAANAKTHNAQTFTIHDGYHWYAQSGTNLIHFWTLNDGSDAEVDIDSSVDSDHPNASSTGDSAAVQVGPLGYEVRKLVSYNDFLYAFRDDGVWEVRLEGDNYVAYRIMEFPPSAVNFTATATWNGALWFNVGPKIYRYTGSTLVDVSPPEIDEQFPPTDPGEFYRDFQSLGDSLFTYTNDHRLLSTDGSSWHIHAWDLSSGFTYVSSPGIIDLTYVDRGSEAMELVIVAHDNSSDAEIAYYDLDDNRYTYPNDADSSGYVWTSWFDGGFVDIPKYWHKVKGFAHIPDDGGNISFKFFSGDDTSVSGETLGTISSSDGNTGKSTVESESVLNKITKSFSPSSSTHEGKRCALKVTLNRAAGASSDSPIFYGYIIEYVLRPETVWGFRPTVVLSDNMPTDDGRTSPYSAAQLYALLREARDQVTPLAYEDVFGHSGNVYISAMRAQVVHRAPNASPTHTHTNASSETLTIREGDSVEVTLSLVELP